MLFLEALENLRETILDKLVETRLVFGQDIDRQGVEQGKLGGIGSYYGSRLSPDGKRVTLDISDETNRGDIWLLDVARGSGTRTLYPMELPFCMAKSRTCDEACGVGRNDTTIWGRFIGQGD